MVSQLRFDEKERSTLGYRGTFWGAYDQQKSFRTRDTAPFHCIRRLGRFLMPLNSKGRRVLESMTRSYGVKRARRVFFASKAKGAISAVEKRKGAR